MSSSVQRVQAVVSTKPAEGVELRWKGAGADQFKPTLAGIKVGGVTLTPRSVQGECAMMPSPNQPNGFRAFPVGMIELEVPKDVHDKLVAAGQAGIDVEPVLAFKHPNGSAAAEGQHYILSRTHASQLIHVLDVEPQ